MTSLSSGHGAQSDQNLEIEKPAPLRNPGRAQPGRTRTSAGSRFRFQIPGRHTDTLAGELGSRERPCATDRTHVVAF